MSTETEGLFHGAFSEISKFPFLRRLLQHMIALIGAPVPASALVVFKGQATLVAGSVIVTGPASINLTDFNRQVMATRISSQASGAIGILRAVIETPTTIRIVAQKTTGAAETLDVSDVAFIVA